MKIVYKSKEVGSVVQSCNYNTFVNKPTINSTELIGNITAGDINSYTITQVDNSVALNRAIRQASELPTPTVANTTYYIGPNSEGLYTIYLSDSDSNIILLGDTKSVALTAGWGISPITSKNILTIDRDVIVTPDSESNANSIQLWTGTEDEYEALLEDSKVVDTTIYNIKETVDTSLSSEGRITAQNVYDTIYPIGYEKLALEDPIVPSGITATWDLISTYDGRSFWIDSTVEAGTLVKGSVPSIVGTVGYFRSCNVIGSWHQIGTGAFIQNTTYGKTTGDCWMAMTCEHGRESEKSGYIDFDASRSSSIYNDSEGNVVRPTAVVAHVYRRIL